MQSTDSLLRRIETADFLHDYEGRDRLILSMAEPSTIDDKLLMAITELGILSASNKIEFLERMKNILLDFAKRHNIFRLGWVQYSGYFSSERTGEYEKLDVHMCGLTTKEYMTKWNMKHHTDWMHEPSDEKLTQELKENLQFLQRNFGLLEYLFGDNKIIVVLFNHEFSYASLTIDDYTDHE